MAEKDINTKVPHIFIGVEKDINTKVLHIFIGGHSCLVHILNLDLAFKNYFFFLGNFFFFFFFFR